MDWVFRKAAPQPLHSGRAEMLSSRLVPNRTRKVSKVMVSVMLIASVAACPDAIQMP